MRSGALNPPIFGVDWKGEGMYTKEEWEAAYEEASSCSWDEIDARESGNVLAPVLVEVYETDEGESDENKVWAAIQAAAQQYADGWDGEQLKSVMTSFASYFGDGWAGVAEEYISDHWSGFPTNEIKDLDKFGKDYGKRESEVYVEEDGGLYVFTRHP